MKRLAFGALFALTACQSFTDIEQKRPYSCNWRDAGVDECPTGWRCGYDNRCFNPTVPVGLKTCKFNQDCFDGFRCSTENACFNPAIETARVCRETADCAPNWRCGINNVCQNQDAGAAYPCRADTDCERGWRCDVLANVCADVDDTLFGEARPVSFTRLHPLLENDVPAMVAMSFPSDGYANRLRLIAEVFDGGVRVSGKDRDGRELLKSLALPAPLGQLADVIAVGDRVLLRATNGDLYGAQVGADAGFALLATRIDRIRQVDPDPSSGRINNFFDPAVLAISQNQYHRFDLSLMPDDLDGGPDASIDGQLLDVAGAQNEVFVLSTRGITHAPSNRTVDGCQSALFPPELRTPSADGGVPDCFFNGTPEPLGSLVRLDAGVRFELLATVKQGQFGYAVISHFPDGRTYASVGFQVANDSRIVSGGDVCPKGGTPLQVSLALEVGAINKTGASLVSRCAATAFDGGFIPAGTWSQRVDNGKPKFEFIDDDALQWQQGVRAQTTTSNTRVHAGRNGTLWYDDFLVGGTAPWVLDRIPGAVLRAVEGDGTPSIFALTDRYIYKPSPGIGFLQDNDSLLADSADFVPAGAVLGQPAWEITRSGVIDLGNFVLSDHPRFVVRVSAADAPLASPASGQLQTLPDGRRVLVVYSGDRLFSADVTEVEKNPYLPPVALEVRLVPSAGVRLRGLAIDGQPRQQADGGVFNIATGFVLTNSALFAFSVVTQARWSLIQVPLPERFGIPLQLWSENGRARLAFDRGTVMTLPERVPITNDLPSNGSTVSDFARLCGTTYAIRADGLYRSILGDGGSRWAPVTLPEVPDDERDGARFFASEGSVFLATKTGRLIELSLAKNDAGVPVCP